MNVSPRKLIPVPALTAALALAACGSGSSDSGAGTGSPGPGSSAAGTEPVSATTSLPQGSEPVQMNPADFTARISNPSLPLRPGSRWISREVENGRLQRMVVNVTSRTKLIDGIRSRVVHDVVSAGGQPVEKTVDWYAQDSAGNVWYMGENTKEYENGQVSSTAGSWQAGVGGAQAGIAMPARPAVGLKYRQEYDKGNAEDYASVISTSEKRTVPFGTFGRLVETRDVNPLEPNFVEHKYYARGIGPVETVQISGGKAHEVLVSYRR